jgi:lysozyme
MFPLGRNEGTMSNGNAQGIDVSSRQGTVNWQQVAGNGKIQFAYAKATEGPWYTDPDFAANWAGMKEAGILRGAYHFFCPADGAREQAAHFLSTVEFESGDLPPALYVETANHDRVWQRVQKWLDLVEAATGMQPILYLNPSWAEDRDAPSSLAAYPLWGVEYDVYEPTLPQERTSWLLWQTSQDGTVAGVYGSVNLDEVNGTLANLMALAMPIRLTKQQQRDLDSTKVQPPRVVDPRTKAAYVLIPATEYEAVREILEDKRRQRDIQAVALRNAGRPRGEDP